MRLAARSSAAFRFDLAAIWSDQRTWPTITPDSVLDAIEEVFEETRVQFEDGDISADFESGIYLHETIASFAENKLLKEILDGLTNRIARLRGFAQMELGDHLIQSLEEHHAILEAMRRRGPEAGAEAMKVHLKNSENRLKEFASQNKGEGQRERFALVRFLVGGLDDVWSLSLCSLKRNWTYVV